MSSKSSKPASAIGSVATSRSASVTSSHSKTNTAPGWLVVRTQIELPHLVDLVVLPHAAGLFAYVRGDVFPPDPTSRMPNC